MICAEAHLPYDRPPLSKGVLTDHTAEGSLAFRSPAWYAEKKIELTLGVYAAGIEEEKRFLHLSDGSRAPYEKLLIATGASPRRLPLFKGYENVSALRTVEDAHRLRGAMLPGSHLLVIGAGFIGQEAAAAARQASVRVTIVEAAHLPLLSTLGEELGSWFADLHRREGVELILGEQVLDVHGEMTVDSVCLAGGQNLRCDHVLVGVGAEPNLGWLAGTQLDSRGVRTNIDGRSEIPGIYAAGDAAAAFDPVLERHVVGSHWEAAGRQGARAASSMLGLDPGALPVSSFWSDLYGTRVQYLGHAALADDVRLEGDLSTRAFTATFTRGGQPVAVLLAGRPQMLPQARALLAATNERIST
jgi:NADPH-dependent 2,4-dienoyl-CoA reductase/sulfur reductase-like enzyme